MFITKCPECNGILEFSTTAPDLECSKCDWSIVRDGLPKPLPKIDGVTLTVGDKFEMTPENAEEFRGIFPDEMIDDMLEQRGKPQEENGIYVVTDVGSGLKPWTLTREEK